MPPTALTFDMRFASTGIRNVVVPLAFALLGASCAAVGSGPIISAARGTSSVQDDAETEWIPGSLYDFSFLVPFSPSWRIATASGNDYWLNPYEVRLLPDGTEGIIFGPPVNAGTYLAREYLLRRDGAETLERLEQTLDGDCGAAKPASAALLGEIHGVKYAIGGAKGCGIGFAFEAGNHTYYLTRVADIRAPQVDLTPDMARIAEAVRE